MARGGGGKSEIYDLATLAIVGFTALYLYQNPQAVKNITDALKNFKLPSIPSASGSGGGDSGSSGSKGVPGGTVGSDGIKWFYGKGTSTTIKQTRKDAGDYRWSGNVSGLSSGMEVYYDCFIQRRFWRRSLRYEAWRS